MIVARIQGGLGNQMFQYAYGLSVAAANRAQLRWHFTPRTTGPQRTLMLRDWRIDADELDPAAGRLCPRGRGGLGWGSLAYGQLPLRHVRERPFGFHPRHLTVGDHSYLDGYWQSEQFFPGLKERLRAIFQPARTPSDASRRVADEIARGPSASLHIRRTDYLNLSYATVCPLDYYRQAVDELLATAAGLKMFVFSDDVAWCQAHLQLPCPLTFVGHNDAAHAHEDIWLMSRCRHHVIANSTFSWWGAWLGEDQTGLTFAPQVWFTDPRMDDSHIVPPSWRRIAANPLAQAA